MACVTALRSAPRGQILVELDGAPWRALPEPAVAEARLRVGLELDRARLRVLRRALHRSEALETATRALRHRDLSRRSVEERLERGAVPAPARAEALEALVSAGYLDDARLARSRAELLAGRGHGDAAIRYDLLRRGLDEETVATALAELEPERARASALVARRGRSAATARFLARKGFDTDAVESALGDPGTIDGR